jgi:phage terminase large subunit GpA-like protein
MVQMIERPAGKVWALPPLPPFVTPQEVLADALPLLDPPSRITVTDAAERFVRLPLAGNWGSYDRTVAPYMTEPGDVTQSRRFQAVAFVGPSQSGKTQMLTSVAMHMVMCEPDPVLVVHMDQKSANAWVEEKLDPIILNSPFLRERLGSGRDDSTFSRKRFKGMRLSIGIPVAQTLSSRTLRKVLLTDYDHMPQVLGPKNAPEGSPYGMARQRVRSYRSRGCVLVESSPAFPVTDEMWRAGPEAPHEMPPVAGGIVRIYNEGTRGRWYWECMDCAGLFEPHFRHLHYDANLDPAEAGAAAVMQCPHCGSLTAHRHKTELNRRALAGRGGWLHESLVIDAATGHRQLVRIDDPSIRKTDVASYSLNGAAAAFGSWEGIVTAFELATRQFAAFNDDSELSRVWYTERGEPYLRQGNGVDGELSVSVLRDNVRDAERGVAPSWARFVTVSIDVQGNRFEVMVTAWGGDGTRIIIDRFQLTQPRADAPAARDFEGRPRNVDPGRYAEDAEVLTALASKVYPVQGARFGLRPCALVVDFNGPAGWSDNAEKFWRARRKAGQGHLWFLSRGLGGFAQRDRVWLATPERGSRGKKARSIKLLNMAVDRLKDSVLAALGRFEAGAGAYPVPRWLEAAHLDEMLSERRGAKGYDLKPGVVRNETLDLSVQALAVAEQKGLNRINPDAPPNWATVGDENPHAVPMTASEMPVAMPGAETTDPSPAPPAPRRRRAPSRLF